MPLPSAAARAGNTLLREGVNCWRVARAKRVGLLVDGEEYFDAFVAAAERARRAITILAWDFNSRTRLRCDADGPALVLGDFLNSLARRRRGLDVHVLIWDYPMIFGTDREFPSVYGLGWKAHHRVHVRYDNTHPVAGCHHQKVVVIDDAIAFCGGLDLTARRWDTCAHRPDEARRSDDAGAYPPFHDVMAMVDGDAARALGDLARERWYRATGKRLSRAPAPSPHAWPDSAPVAMRDVDVAISRTQPPRDDADAVREIAAMYVDMIAAARDLIYIENQYFTSHVVGEALERRLLEPRGPEVVVVLRRLSHGWLEEVTMQNLRKAQLARLREADRHGRFHAYYPHIEGLVEGTCIDVHSKVMIVDDEWLHVGSANTCNRSMGFDTECDITIEARGREDLATAIAEFRHRLVAEHLGVAPERVAAAVSERGSIAGAVEALRTPARTLEPLHEEPAPDALISLASLADLEQPVTIDRLITQFAPRGEQAHGGHLWLKLAGVALVLGGLTAMWHYTPLADWVTADRITAWAHRFADSPWAPFAVIVAYTPAAIVMFPRALITLFAVVAFGAWIGFALGMTGVLVAALLTYVAGTRLDRSTVRRLSGARLERIIRVLRERGLVAMTALRLVPLAPFAVEGVIAGAIRINRVDFMLGTALGMLPGTLAATVFGEQLEAALRNPADVNLWLLGGVVTGLVAATLYVRRWLLTTTLRG